MRIKIAWYKGNNFQGLVQNTLAFEKARKKELEKE